MRSEFKISIVAKLESGKPVAQIAREYRIHAENGLLKKALAMTTKKVREERRKPRLGGDL